MPKKVFIAVYDSTVAKLFTKWGGFELTEVLVEADLVCFTGGADVQPKLYDHPTHSSTFCDALRDRNDMSIYALAREAGKPMVGICRGGQFLNVMNGGKMYQDVTGHIRMHEAIIEGKRMFVSSTHHQMMKPAHHANVVGVGIGVHCIKANYHELNGGFETINRTPGELDIEAVVYDNHVCFQPHPEFAMYDGVYTACADMFFELISRYCFKEYPTPSDAEKSAQKPV